MLGTEISDPVPGEYAFYGDSDIWQIGFYYRKQGILTDRKIIMIHYFSGLIENTNIHILGVEIDTAIILVLLCIESHLVLLWKFG
jgi:hypothetical protein